jgi:hypothetical protein
MTLIRKLAQQIGPVSRLTHENLLLKNDKDPHLSQPDL